MNPCEIIFLRLDTLNLTIFFLNGQTNKLIIDTRINISYLRQTRVSSQRLISDARIPKKFKRPNKVRS